MLPRIIRLILCSWFPPSRVKVTSLYTRAISVYKGYQCGGPKVRHDNLDNRHNCNRRRIENSENLRFPAAVFFLPPDDLPCLRLPSAQRAATNSNHMVVQ